MSGVVDSFNHLQPTEWTAMYYFEDMKLVSLSSNSSEYQRIYIKTGSITPTSIERVQNPYLWGCYKLRKEEAVKRNPNVREVELWHATDPSLVDSITTNNFDWRRSNRAKFGKGVCFSPDCDYANQYSTHGGALILCKVLVGHAIEGTEFTVIPPHPIFDTTTGNKGKVYVKYQDNEFYPEYVVYYDYVKPAPRRRIRHLFAL